MLIEEAIEKFHKEFPPEVTITCELPAVLEPLSQMEESYGVNFSGLVVLVLVGEVNLNNLTDYLKDNLGLEAAKAESAANELKEKVFSFLTERLTLMNANPNKEMSVIQEKTIVEKIFSKRFLDELSYPSVITNAVNMRIFYILARDSNFKGRITQALLANDEVLTEGGLILDEQKVPATVGNWLKAYIAANGSQTHDSVSQTNFLVNSEYGQKLSEQERSLVGRTLKTYINIAFFPDSMPSDEGEGWEIINIEDNESMSEQDSSVSLSNTPPELLDQQKVDEFFAEIDKTVESVSVKQDSLLSDSRPLTEESLEEPLAEVSHDSLSPSSPIPSSSPSYSSEESNEMQNEEIMETNEESLEDNSLVEVDGYSSNTSDEVKELHLALKNYSPDSLEYKALEEEIARLESEQK